VEKRGDRWVARWRDDTGKSRARSFIRKGDAQRYLVEIDSSLQKGSYTSPVAGKRTLRDYAEPWLAAQGGEASTRETRTSVFSLHILAPLGGIPLAVLARQPSLITGWLAGLEREGLAPIYVRTCLSNLSGVLNAAVDDGLIARNPCAARSVRAPRVVRPDIEVWEPARVAAVRAALPARYAALIDCGAGLGLRQGEILGLSPDDVIWLKGEVRIRRQVRIVGARLCFAPPKGNKERAIPLPETVKLALAAHLERYPATMVTLPWKEPGGRPETALLVFTSRGAALNRNDINSRLWKPALEAAGVPVTRTNGMHVLRHTFASTLLAGGVDIRALASYLGHSDPGFTLRTYTHLMKPADDRMRAAVDAVLAGSPTENAAVTPVY
jgi:integrase